MRALLFLALLLVGCSTPPTPAPTPTRQAAAKPATPLALESPPAPSKMLDDLDLTTLSAGELSGGGFQLLQSDKPRSAAQAFYFAVQKGSDDRYNLACALARAHQVEAAFYWLQSAAAEEGVDADWAAEDPDLETLRADKRWAEVAAYLHAYNEYFAHQEMLRTVLIRPEGYDPEKPIVTVVGLHGLGGSETFVNDGFQELADRSGLAFVGVSGTKPLGPKSCSWSEDRELDHQQVQKALASLKGKLRPGPIILFGFSQGAQMAFELAAAHPDVYAGAISLSPGLRNDSKLAGLQAQPGNRKQHFVLVAGAKEHPHTVAHVRDDAKWARAAGAEVQEKLYPGISEHAFPPDFAEAFPKWLELLRKSSR